MPTTTVSRLSRSSMAAQASRGFSAAAVPSRVSGSFVGSMSSTGSTLIAASSVEDLKRLRDRIISRSSQLRVAMAGAVAASPASSGGARSVAARIALAVSAARKQASAKSARFAAQLSTETMFYPLEPWAPPLSRGVRSIAKYTGVLSQLNGSFGIPGS
jgi:hypothetical protein